MTTTIDEDLMERNHKLKVALLLERIKLINDYRTPGEWGCVTCGYLAPANDFRHGGLRGWPQYKEGFYCPSCSANVETSGYVDERGKLEITTIAEVSRRRLETKTALAGQASAAG